MSSIYKDDDNDDDDCLFIYSFAHLFIYLSIYLFTGLYSVPLIGGLDGWWLLWLADKILALLRLTVNFFGSLKVNRMILKINFHYF